jgi:transcriptional regulator with GAF, ATPase, and Fis domain
VNIGVLRAVILSIAEAQSVKTALTQIVSGIAEFADIALARVWLLQREVDCPVCAAAGNKDGEAALHLVASRGIAKSGEEQKKISGRSHKIGIGERKIGKIAQERKAMIVADVRPELDWVADPDWIRREGVKSFAGYPLLCRGELLGVLAVFNREAFSEEDFAWLRTFADHAAVAIWNARAFDELKRLRNQLEMENEYLHDEVRSALDLGEFVGRSKQLQRIVDQIDLVASTDSTVLITGESGTGKELVARAIHEKGRRNSRPFVKVNCGAIPEALFESEFFGHAKGAFTGAIKDRVGRFELAEGGDIFLDEIGELPLSLQAKLLRVLQEKQFERVGETRTRTANVRVISATNRDLEQEVRAGKFREDLFYRLSVFPIEVPPLRERKDDIAPLAEHFLRTRAVRLNIAAPRLTRKNVAELTTYNWPGNVRELENVIERAVILSRHSGELRFELPTNSVSRFAESDSAQTAPRSEILSERELREQEIQNILAALKKTNGKVFGPNGAAKLLGVKPTTLASRISALGLKKKFVLEVASARP